MQIVLFCTLLSLAQVQSPAKDPVYIECPDLRHFPSQQTFDSWKELNYDFRHWSELNAGMEPKSAGYGSPRYYTYMGLNWWAEQWLTRYQELDYARFAWDHYCKADPVYQLDWLYKYLNAVEKLRKTIGRESFILGDLGLPPIPVWAFVRD